MSKLKTSLRITLVLTSLVMIILALVWPTFIADNYCEEFGYDGHAVNNGCYNIVEGMMEINHKPLPSTMDQYRYLKNIEGKTNE